MSNVIDQRIVEMKFDNQNFEKNVQTSRNTLKNLKNDLNLQDSAKSLSALTTAASNVDLSSLTTAAEMVTNRFSTMGIVTATIISNLTNTAVNAVKRIGSSIIQMSYSGGLSRAMNIEKAKFQLEGLKIAWEDISGDLAYAVDNTAYSMDAAATAASQLAATGIKIGNVAKEVETIDDAGVKTTKTIDSMALSLRAISGVAAQTSSDYESVAHIFSTIAGNGKVMGMQLTQLSSYGLNAAADLAQAMGTTEANVREMVSKGKITYEKFAEVMFDKYAEHAVKANETLTGVMANTKSALSRIGAEFVQPIIENNGPLVNLMETIRLKINAIKKEITGSGHASELFTTNVISALNAIREWVAELDFKKYSGLFNNIFGTGINVVKAIISYLRVMKEAFQNVFPAKSIMQINKVSYAFRKFADKARLDKLSLVTVNVKRALEGLFSIIDIGAKTVKALVKPFIQFGDSFGEIGAGIIHQIGLWGRWIKNLDELWTKLGYFDKISEYMYEFVYILTQSYYEGGKGLAGISDMIWDFAAQVVVTVSDLLSFLTGIDFSWLRDGIVDVIHSIRNNLNNFLTSIRDNTAIVDFLEDLKISFESVDIDTSGLQKFIDSLKESFHPITAIANALKAVREVIGNIVKWALPKLTAGFKNFINNIGEGFKNISLAVVLYQLKNVFIQLKKVIGMLSPDANSMKSNPFKQMIGQIEDAFLRLEKTLTVGYFLKLAVAMLILASAMAIIASIDSDKLATTFAAFSGIFIEMLAAMSAVGNFFSGPGTKDLAKTMLTFSAAILILAFALRTIAKCSPEEMAVGLFAVSMLLVEVSAIAGILGQNETKMMKGASGMIAISIAVLLLAKAVKSLGQLPIDQMLTGIGAVAALLLELALFTVMTGGAKNMINLGIGLVGVATAMVLLSKAAKAFGEMEWEDLGKAGASIGVLVALLALFTQISDPSHMLGMGAAMILIAESMTIFAKAATDFSEVGWEGLGKAGASIAILLTVFAAFAEFVNGGQLLLCGLALDLIAVSMLGFANVAKIFAAIPWDGLAQAGLAIGTFLSMIAVFTGLTSGTDLLLTSAGLVVFAGAITLLVPAIAALGALNMETMLKALAALAGSLTAIGVAASLMTPFIPSILALSGALALFGASAILLGAGLTVLGAGITAFVAGISTLVILLDSSVKSVISAIDILISALTKNAPKIGFAVGNMLGNLIKALGKFITPIATMITGLVSTILVGLIKVIEPAVNLIVTFIVKIIEGIKTVIPQVVSLLETLLNAVLTALVSFAPKVATTVMVILATILNVIAQSIPQIIQAGVDIIVAFINGIISALDQIVNAAFTAMITFINALATCIETNVPLLTDAISRLILAMLNAAIAVIRGMLGTFFSAGRLILTNVIDGIKSLINLILTTIRTMVSNMVNAIKSRIGDFREVGRNIISGLIEGLKSMLSHAVEAASNLGHRILEAAKRALDINSPSKEFADIGKFVVLGLAGGLEKYTGKAVDATETMADHITDAAKGLLGGLGASQDGLEFSPRIVPVIDMTEIQNGRAQLQSMFGNTQAMDVAASFNSSMSTSMSAQLDKLTQAVNKMQNSSTAGIYNLMEQYFPQFTKDIYLDGDKISKRVETNLSNNLRRSNAW